MQFSSPSPPILQVNKGEIEGDTENVQWNEEQVSRKIRNRRNNYCTNRNGREKLDLYSVCSGLLLVEGD